MTSLEATLLSMEKLDRTSPELWPEPIPGMTEFALYNNISVSNGSKEKEPWMSEFNSEDLSLLHHYSRAPMGEIIAEVRRIQDLAYELGMEEAKEMTRGKYLNILQRRRR